MTAKEKAAAHYKIAELYEELHYLDRQVKYQEKVIILDNFPFDGQKERYIKKHESTLSLRSLKRFSINKLLSHEV